MAEIVEIPMAMLYVLKSTYTIKSIRVRRVCSCVEQLSCFVFFLLVGGREGGHSA